MALARLLRHLNAFGENSCDHCDHRVKAENDSEGGNKLVPPKLNSNDDRPTKEGRPILLKANHFPIKVKGSIYHYNVTPLIVFKRIKRKPTNLDRMIMLCAFEKLKVDYKSFFHDPCTVVYDGLTNVFSSRKLPIPLNVLFGEVVVFDPSLGQDVQVGIKLKFAEEIDMNKVIEDSVSADMRWEDSIPLRTGLLALNVIFAMRPSLSKLKIGRSFFSEEQPRAVDLGGGKAAWVGMFQSVRYGWKPFLNVDISHKAMYKQQNLLEHIKTHLLKESSNLESLKKVEIVRINSALKGLKFKYHRPDGAKRTKRFTALAPSAREEIIRDSEKTVEEYFKERYEYEIKHPLIPCVFIGNVNARTALPMELCEIVAQVFPPDKRLESEETAKMIRETAIPPKEREQKIRKIVTDDINRKGDGDPYINGFEFEVGQEMTQVTGRVLPAPALTYDNTPSAGKVGVKDGQWRMQQNQTFIHGGVLEEWALLDLAKVEPEVAKKFVQEIMKEGENRGMKIKFPKRHTGSFDPDDLESIETAFETVVKNIPNIQMVLVFLPFANTSGYDCVKTLGDVKFGVPTQCALKAKIRKAVEKCDRTLFHNIILKMNAKLGGTNHALHCQSRLAMFEKPVMIIGADVIHSKPGEKQPSIVAVTASTDPLLTSYICEARIQFARRPEELISNMEEITRKLLLRFYRATRQKPYWLVYYRDGVSDSQFTSVLNHELVAIREACTAMEENYQPMITFFVAQKRHKTKLFPQDYEKDGVGRMKNVPPGTIVNSEITKQKEFDFFMASQLGIQGTTRPTHYHLLWDDSDLCRKDPDLLEKLTFYLCHLFARCEKSVSIPAPIYYSDLAATRARSHFNYLLKKADYNIHEIPDEDLEKMYHCTVKNYFV